MDYRILGPLEVLSEGRRCALGGSTQRALAVDLALHANEVVATERVIDDLWGEGASDNAATALPRRSRGDHRAAGVLGPIG